MPVRSPFRLRAHEVSRLEAFTDIVFGFALTLLVVSLEVPKTYAELMHDMRGFFGFALCFAILIWIWHTHYTFSRRYALHDELTVLMNTVLLFVVLFYVYPLKFLFSLATFTIEDRTVDSRALFLIYGAGYAAIFGLYALMYGHALRKREELELNEYERVSTIESVWMNAMQAAVAVLSMLLAVIVPARWISVAGFVYFAIGIGSSIIGSRFGARKRQLLSATDAASPEPTPAQT